MGREWGWAGGFGAGVCGQGLFLILKAMRRTLGKVGVGGQGLSRRPLRATRTRALVGSPEARVDPGTSHVTPAAPPPAPPAPTAPASRTPCAGRRRLSGRWRPCGLWKSRGFSGPGLGGSGRCGRGSAPPAASGWERGVSPAVRGGAWPELGSRTPRR